MIWHHIIQFDIIHATPEIPVSSTPDLPLPEPAAPPMSSVKPAWFQILLALSGGPRHGADVVRAVLEQTEGRMQLWPATLYGSLDELASREWIEEVTDPEERPEGASERKRIYRITGEGARVLAGEAHHLRSLAGLALERLASGETTP